MAAALYGNWIDGLWRSAHDGAYFELGDRVGGRERWARSTAADVRAAFESCAAGASHWTALRREERVRLLRRVPAALDLELLEPALARDLGLEAGELRARLEDEMFRFEEALELLAQGADGGGVGVFQAHWSDLVGGLGARLATRLVAGHSALLLSDPLLPRAADGLARAFEDADLPRGVLALLHGDTRDLADAALGTPALAFVRLKGLDGRLETTFERHAARVDDSWEAWRVSNASFIVHGGDDARACALEVVDKALGRSSTLCGQFPGAIARVLCHQRLFSRFTEELLARLEASPDVAHPVAPLEPHLAEHVADAWSLGLDEGATPIFGAAPQDRRDEDAESSPETIDAAPRSARDGLRAIVFTNVDPRSGLAHLTRPAPLLGLVRATSDEEAGELQRELDGQPKQIVRTRR